MQVQAFEGYWENGSFHSPERPIQVKGKKRAILTLLDEPERIIKMVTDDTRVQWLNRLDEAFKLSTGEDLPDFPPRQPMREPHGLTD